MILQVDSNGYNSVHLISSHFIASKLGHLRCWGLRSLGDFGIEANRVRRRRGSEASSGTPGSCRAPAPRPAWPSPGRTSCRRAVW